MPRMKNGQLWPPMKVRKVWRIVRPVVVAGLSVLFAYAIFSSAIEYVVNRYISPVDANDATPIIFEVKKNDSASEIANKLYNALGQEEKGLIANKAVFKIYVDFLGKAQKLQSGTYILSRNMDIAQIVDILCEGNPPPEIVKFKMQEGYTISGLIWALEQAGVVVDEEAFLALCNDADLFEKYKFIAQVEEIEKTSADKRDYLLEGYLFPDTYEVYVDAQPETIINKMLVRFNEIFTDTYIARAQELNMHIDQIITLASIIEREASAPDDFSKVSAVFHNRLREGQKLESCATMQYVLKVNKYVYTEAERAIDSPYNTYLYEGLPVGPISNPGKLAIEAALYPNESFIEKDYRFFCNMNPEETQELAFARTYEEHQQNVDTYSKYWS